MKDNIESRLLSFQHALSFLAGLTMAISVIFIAGDLRSPAVGFPTSWFVLWLISLIGSAPMGIVMLIGSSWRTLPLTRRRGTAIGYLTIGLLDLFSLAVGTSLAFGPSGPGLWIVVVAYSLGLAVVVAFTQPARRKTSEELFP